MASRRAPAAGDIRDAVLAVGHWLRDGAAPEPARASLAAAVRLTARALAARAPGGAVEVRIPPFAAVQCLPGPRHTRGTPANVVETDARTWLLLATGLLGFPEAAALGRLALSGARAADIAAEFPLLTLPAGGAAGPSPSADCPLWGPPP